MSKLADYLNYIAADEGICTTLAIAGLAAVLASAQPAAAQSDTLLQRKTAEVHSLNTAEDVSARVDDQLGRLKQISNELDNSHSYANAAISDADKGRMLARHYTEMMRGITRTGVAPIDSYFLAKGAVKDPKGDLAAMVKSVNDKKQTLLEATYFLQRVQTAFLVGNEGDVEEYPERLSDALENIQIPAKPTAAAQEEGGEKISVEADKPEPVAVSINRDRIYVTIERNPIKVNL